LPMNDDDEETNDSNFPEEEGNLNPRYKWKLCRLKIKYSTSHLSESLYIRKNINNNSMLLKHRLDTEGKK
jgi:hypothetical protein